MSLDSSLTLLRERIKKSINASDLSSGSVALLAACKSQPEALIRQAIDRGIADFGENRVQEAEEKWPGLKKAFPHIRLHLIGPLQTNKVKDALALFDVIQTIDRMKLADAIAHHITTSSHHQFYIQVNTGEEPQKGGVIPKEADALIDYCKTTLQLPVTGLMCVPPVDQPPAPHFALLRQIAERHGLKELSMGMSEDFETAIRMGSTCVRIGRALFGERLG